MKEADRLTRMFLIGQHLWKQKKILLLGTVIGAVAGLLYGLLAPPVYMARAIIYPKEISATPDTTLGSGCSGALNPLSGVSHLNRVEVVLNSPELAETVIRKENLLALYFPEYWDAAKHDWKLREPPISFGVTPLKAALSTRVDTYKLTMEIKVRARDAGTAHRILKAYLEALNERLKQTVVRDANANKEFLESQLEKTYDPWIREKIQQLILRQVETGMMLNANAFEILDGPEYPHIRESPHRKHLLIIFSALGFAISCLGILFIVAVKNGRETAPRA